MNKSNLKSVLKNSNMTLHSQPHKRMKIITEEPDIVFDPPLGLLQDIHPPIMAPKLLQVPKERDKIFKDNQTALDM